jgi:hypothetical protein
MSRMRYLALLPVAAVVLGPFVGNQVTPFVLGMPFLLAWMSLTLVLTSVVMAVVYFTDPANKGPEQQPGEAL